MPITPMEDYLIARRGDAVSVFVDVSEQTVDRNILVPPNEKTCILVDEIEIAIATGGAQHDVQVDAHVYINDESIAGLLPPAYPVIASVSMRPPDITAEISWTTVKHFAWKNGLCVPAGCPLALLCYFGNTRVHCVLTARFSAGESVSSREFPP